jgi:uncharacterized membrane protein YoaK (UPF0700 family)
MTRSLHDEGLEAMDGVGDALATRLLPVVLSMVAGSLDVISFMALDGLFAAHITGNLVILAARVAAGNPAPPAHMISVPVFIAALAATRLLAAGLECSGIATLRPLLLLQFALLCAFSAVCISHLHSGPEAPVMVLAAMLGVAAMAVQNALVQICLTGTPSTAVMTTNITRFAVDLGDLLLGNGRNDVAKGRERARRTGVAIAAFLVGCGLGAWSVARVGLSALMLPTGLALAALAIASALQASRQ